MNTTEQFRALAVKGLKGVIAQKAWAVNSLGYCTYLNMKGHRCVVGHMAPFLESHHDPMVSIVNGLEGEDDLDNLFLAQLEHGLGCAIDLALAKMLRDLQVLHDKLANSASGPPTLEMFQARVWEAAFPDILPILQTIAPEELQ